MPLPIATGLAVRFFVPKRPCPDGQLSIMQGWKDQKKKVPEKQPSQKSSPKKSLPE